MSTTGYKTWPKLTAQDEFRFLAELVLKHSTGDHTLVSLHDQQGGTEQAGGHGDEHGGRNSSGLGELAGTQSEFKHRAEGVV